MHGKEGMEESLIDNKQFDIVLPKSTADTGAQCFLLGADHLPDMAERGGSSAVRDQPLLCQCNNGWQPGSVLCEDQRWALEDGGGGRVQVHGLCDQGVHYAHLIN